MKGDLYCFFIHTFIISFIIQNVFNLQLFIFSRELLKELENTVLKLTRTASPQQSHDTLGRTVASKDGRTTISQTFNKEESSSSILKTTEDMKTLKRMVKRKVEESIEDIIEETAG